jgi:hypothetical protein
LDLEFKRKGRETPAIKPVYGVVGDNSERQLMGEMAKKRMYHLPQLGVLFR